jgi:hypothetical protein
MGYNSKRNNSLMGDFQGTYSNRSAGSSSAQRRKYPSGRKKDDTFFSQAVSISDYIYMPEGFEIPMFLIYFISIPYSTGLIFIYFFIADREISNFIALDVFIFLPVWSIGYEVVAGVLMALIIYSAFTYKARKLLERKKRDEVLRRQHKSTSKLDYLLDQYSQD